MHGFTVNLMLRNHVVIFLKMNYQRLVYNTVDLLVVRPRYSLYSACIYSVPRISWYDRVTFILYYTPYQLKLKKILAYTKKKTLRTITTLSI